MFASHNMSNKILISVLRSSKKSSHKMLGCAPSVLKPRYFALMEKIPLVIWILELKDKLLAIKPLEMMNQLGFQTK